ncbi:MAG: glycosyl transferase, group 1 [Microgenomates group bacterium GW2011_GWC1_39_7b]|uniref:Glycosyl transferase, group 1 n=3 Tax=Candidatus Woeseibacteriota TaxID=1752722 RepID=A0A0G0LIR4_9BACT|nr:MAG: glycosyl transferase, group 1 [Candidatus Woesebacteria bacterium GW2011_GWB1_39_10]KKR26024.1 MAG: glycosyl transferase, group 1 [Microgenomates group bacterium GW2011_GWC1_39_7b]KKR74387.1 MAG: glycosyl transferase, group 1 [Candidatus Woesebacteria bacterium GW2011_GWA2_40_7]KKS90769.1 MAG: glycosyl transferase, group 1 [Candidatus Woesebacteria bacterium GW2011_GWA1_43_12]
MKILIDGRLYGLENAGLGRYQINLIAELAKIDVKNDYILLLRKKYFDTLKLPKNWKKVLADFRHYSLYEQVKLPGLINKENPDLVHFPHFNVPIFYRGKFIVTIHDMLMHDFAGLSASTLPGPLYLFKQAVYKFVFRRAVFASFRIIVPSYAVKEGLKKYYNIPDSKIEIIYEGFDKRIVQGETKVNSPYFIYVGNAYPHKNLDRLVETTVLLNKNSDKKMMLLIASARDVFISRLEEVIDKFGASQFVKLLGFVSDEKLGGLFKNSIAFVFPSLSEGFGLPGLEAISSGTLLLASQIPVFREIYGKNAIYFNPLDISSIEKAMKNALEMDTQERRRRIEEGQKFSKRYSWVKMAKEALEIYEEAIKKESSDNIRQSK